MDQLDLIPWTVGCRGLIFLKALQVLLVHWEDENHRSKFCRQKVQTGRTLLLNKTIPAGKGTQTRHFSEGEGIQPQPPETQTQFPCPFLVFCVNEVSVVRRGCRLGKGSPLA